MRCLGALALIAANLAAQQPADLVAFADSVFAPWNSTHTPGCAVGAARDGRTVLTRGYGMADLETATPITSETIFESGSVAKQFTAAAVVLLALDGKLALDDPVERYLPEIPRYDRPITIRNLLTHTSGLREWSDLVAWEGWPRGSRVHTQADVLEIVFRQKNLNYPVGDYYSYTNSGFAIAAALVERVGGKTFQQFTLERIFAPLGMTHTQWRDDFTRLVPGRAQAYMLDGGQWHLAMPFEDVIGSSGLMTTVGDWLLWNEALTQNRLAPGLTDSLTHRMRLTGGREISYALGLFVRDYRGVPEVYHSGGTAGYSTFLARFPKERVSIAILCNAIDATPGIYAHRLADRLIADFAQPAAVDSTRPDATTAGRVVGLYQNLRTHMQSEVTAGAAARLQPMGNGWFLQPDGNTVTFSWREAPSASLPPTRMRVAQTDGDTLDFVFRGAAWTPKSQRLAGYAGRYRSGELGATYDVRLAGDTLELALRPGVTFNLRPWFEDSFTTPDYAVWFTRDKNGHVDAMHVAESRMWDLVAPRVIP